MINCRQLFRQHHIAHADRRGNGFGKCTKIDHFTVRIASLKCRDRLALISELAVIIILDDIALLWFIRPSEQFNPTLHWHHDTGRILMGRRHICNIRYRFPKHIHPHTITVHLYWLYWIWLAGKQTIRLLICRILYCNHMISSDYRAQHHQKIIISCSYYNLMGITFHPTRLIKIITDYFSKT